MNSSLAHPFYIALKASLAALLALSLVEGVGIRDRLSATFVAVVCISPTVFTGLRRGLEQIIASSVGGGVTLGLTFFLPRAPALLVGLFITISLCFRVGLGRAYLVAAFTVLYVLFIPGPSVTLTLEHRLASVAMGVFSAIAVNLVVSILSYRRVFARRMRIAKNRVAQELETLATVLEQGSFRARLFDDTFPLLRALDDEISDAVRESRMYSRQTRQQMEGTQTAAQELLSVAHHGKNVSLLLKQTPGVYPHAARFCRTLALSLRDNSPLTPGECEEAVKDPLFRAAEALEAMRALPSL